MLIEEVPIVANRPTCRERRHVQSIQSLCCAELSVTWCALHLLGEDLRFVLLSVTEGEDKPLKYPTIFNSADVAIITKSDLVVAVEFDEGAARRNIQAVSPGMKVFRLSAKTGEGMTEYLEFIESQRMRSWASASIGN